MKRAFGIALGLLLALACSNAALGKIENADFETGGFAGWQADPTWTTPDTGFAWYSGWRGKHYAWSGGKGEEAMGKLKSKPFTLDKPLVGMLISGWDSIRGTGAPRRWNYITLNLENGTELDRVYAPNTTVFVPATLDGSEHVGERVYIEAVDDADQPTFSMLCLDDIRTVDLPKGYGNPVPTLPRPKPSEIASIRNDAYVVEVSRRNGSITRILDRKSGIELIREPRLARSFKFSLPLPGKEPWQGLEANYIDGKDQKLASIESSSSKLVLHWGPRLKSTLGGTHALSCAMTIALVGDGIRFEFDVDNTTPYKVGEVYFPMIGGLQGLGTKMGQLKTTEFVRPAGANTASAGIFRVYTNMASFSDTGPEQWYLYGQGEKIWAGFSGPKASRSVRIDVDDPKSRSLIARMEMLPGIAGTPREDGNWPRPEELNGLPVGVSFCFVEFAQSPAHTPYSAAPVVVRFVDGDLKAK